MQNGVIMFHALGATNTYKGTHVTLIIPLYGVGV